MPAAACDRRAVGDRLQAPEEEAEEEIIETDDLSAESEAEASAEASTETRRSDADTPEQPSTDATEPTQ